MLEAIKAKCLACGKEFERRPHGKRVYKFCSKSCIWKNDPIARFWNRVSKSEGCWEWTGSRQAQGYGVCKWDGKRMGAHRASWLITHDTIEGDLFVLHKCDNPPCVRPDHLFLGTNKDNMQDAAAKGRLCSGDDQWARKHPEKVKRGVDSWAHQNALKFKRGELSWSANNKGRLARGDRHASHLHPETVRRGQQVNTNKLTPEQVIDIRSRTYGYGDESTVAREFGIARMTVRSIRLRMSWKHLPD